MRFDDVLYVLEQESDKILPKKEKEDDLDLPFDEDIFNRLANFVVNLTPENLEGNQIEDIINIIDDMESELDDVKEEVHPGMARKSTVGKNSSSKKWYRENKGRVKSKKKEFKRSAEGRKRDKNKDRLEKQGRNPSGERKLRYNVRKKSDRR